MNLLIRNALKGFFSLFGFQIIKSHLGILITKDDIITYQTTPLEEDKFKWLQNMNINTVIDVGAHKGEFALQLYTILPNARFYCFEPLPDIFLELQANLKDLNNFSIFNLAVGDQQGEITMYRSSFSPSSSIRKMADIHKNNFPYTSGGKLENVEINALDKITNKLELEDNILLKIDVQGYEDKVIQGGSHILERSKVIIIETSFYELYERQALFGDIHKLLAERGFVYSGNWEETKSPNDGLPLQQDSIFIKR
ncbi:MAG TPA: FkbM family methyltransferase [Coleofasciculaceae cyanobacterium]|jgi:FkbM family methyltransferase